jgi:cysteine protease ATG4
MDPSMLIGFLIKDEDDWENWKQRVCSVPGKPIIHVSNDEASLFGPSSEREGAVDEVEALDEDYDDSDGEVTNRPTM